MANVVDAKGSLDELAMAKLVRLLGADRAKPVFDRALARAELVGIASADDLVKFADALAAEGGFVAAMAGILRLKAITLGAVL